MSAVCSGCGSEIAWTRLVTVGVPDGAPHPRDVVAEPAPRPKLLAVQASGRALLLSEETTAQALAEDWAGKGVLFFESHFATCSEAQAFRVHPEQGTLL